MKNSERIIEEYLKRDDWRVKENSTVNYSVGGLILSNSGNVTADYWLSKIYPKEISDLHKNADIHIHDLSMLSGYCAGWSLKQLIQEGLGGVPGKITSSPASHLSTLCNQMVNFLGIMQNEWAGAQAFSSFDTYLAPFVKADNLTYKEVKQCIQSFIYGVNTPSRWGCVDTNTEVLSINGFKKYNELKEHDLIYTWNNGKLELNEVRKVIVKPFKGKMNSYVGRGYHQFVTPTHRMLVKKHNINEYAIMHSEDVLSSKTNYALPTMFNECDCFNSNLSDNEICFASIVYADGSFDYRDGKIHKVSIFKSPNRDGNDLISTLANSLGLEYTKSTKEGGFESRVNQYVFYGDSARTIESLVGNKKTIHNQFLRMNREQSKLFLSTWAQFDGDNKKFRCQYDNDDIRDALMQIAVNAGYCSYVYKRNKTHYVKVRKFPTITSYTKTEIDYDGLVWCPNVENGTAVFRKDGTIFISGQTQAPFTNITLDWTVPDDLAYLNCIVGGKELDYEYKDCQKEMDMINKAFIEIMIEGDANGRGFQYPIPTYSITKDFDWSETENNKLLFEMTAKYGTPYFSNYINSDMEPSDVRSMAILGTQNLIYKDEFGRISKNEVRHLVNNWIKNPNRKYQVLMNGKFVDIIDMFRVPYKKYDKYVKINLANGQYQNFSYDHKCVIVREGKIIDCLAQDVTSSDKLLLARHGYNESSIGNYQSGKIIGYYLAEGWLAHNDVEVDFAINDKQQDICEEIKKFFESNFASRVSITLDVERHCNKVKVFGHGAAMFVKQFVSGKKATKKRIDYRAYDTSLDFRKGVYDGYLATDGSEKNNIFAHTTNKELCKDMISLFATIGKYFKYQENKNNTRYFKLDKSDLERFTSYKLLINNLQPFNDDYYIVDVSGVELLDAKRIDTVYNFTVNTHDHLYELPNGIITHQCCRLRLDLRELRKKSGGFFGSGESTGSVGVVTINMPRIAYLSENEIDFYERLDKIMDLSAESLNIKRRAISQWLDDGLYPYTKRYLGTFNNHFSTIGLVGMNEVGLNAKWLRKDLTHKETQEFTKQVLNHMRNKLSDYQEKYGDLFNLEATPAESTSFRLAKHDVEKYPDIITAAKTCDDTPYYTNSSHLPVGYTEDIFSALDIQDSLQTLYTSGTVFHAFLGEKLPDWKAAANLVRKIAENYELPYYTLSPTYSVCRDHGYLEGEKTRCPVCNNTTEIYSRITGYYRPIQNWNDGKLQEYKDRKEYIINNKPIECTSCQVDIIDEHIDKNILEDQVTLVATTTCPNCKIASSILDKAGVLYTKIYADQTPEQAEKFGIKQAPTLVVVNNGQIEKYTGVSDIKKYLKV